jgi:hypothetical protein
MKSYIFTQEYLTVGVVYLVDYAFSNAIIEKCDRPSNELLKRLDNRPQGML